MYVSFAGTWIHVLKVFLVVDRDRVSRRSQING